MKNKITILMLVLLIGSVLPASSIAQDNCNEYLLLHDNARYEISTYTNKDKLSSRATYYVTDVTNNGGTRKATITTKAFDNKDKLVSEGEFTIECANGLISMDMSSLVSPGMMEAYKEMEVSMTGDKMLYPQTLKAGQKLDDGTMVIEVKDKNSGQTMSTMTMRIVDRMVEGEESVQVPAGTFKSYKIKQSTEMENRAMGIKMPGMKVQTIEFFVPNMGMVRTESYRNGKLMSYSVLSKVNK